MKAPSAANGTIKAAIKPRMIWNTPKTTSPVLRSGNVAGSATGVRTAVRGTDSVDGVGMSLGGSSFSKASSRCEFPNLISM